MRHEDFIQAYTSPELLPVQSAKGKSSFGRNVKSDTDWTEGSEIEDIDISPKPTGELLASNLLEILFMTVVLSQGLPSTGSLDW